MEPDLAPYESRIIVIAHPGLIRDAGPVPRAPRPPPVLLDLSAGWKVTFAGFPQPVTMDPLTSWTEVRRHEELLWHRDL